MDLIWNISLICPWDCDFCCTDAVHVKRIGNEIRLKESGLSKTRTISVQRSDDLGHLRAVPITPNFYDYALLDRQRRGLELTLGEKLEVIKNIDAVNPKIDFAGGDPLACLENFLVISAACARFGRSQISVTSTGHSISRYQLSDLAENIGTYEFTYDESVSTESSCRPKGYNKINLHWAKRIGALGVRTKCQIPLHKDNSSVDQIARIYEELAAAGINEVLLMRTFPVGRGMEFLKSQASLSQAEYRMAIDSFKNLEQKFGGTRIKIQCALKHLYSSGQTSNPCDMMHSSYGINSRGMLLLSAWATNDIGDPLSDDFVLGNLSTSTISELSTTAKAERYRSRLNSNFGHCKIFAYSNSPVKSEDAMFMRLDPLYSND